MLNAKEKAKELVEKFFDLDMHDCEGNVYWIEKENAKKCALICVDEMLKQPQPSDKQLNFLIEVKQEINNL